MSDPTSTPYRRTAFLAGMASYLDAGAIVTTGIALVLYQRAFGLGPAEIGVLSGLLTITFAVGALFGGRLGDRYGRRRVFSLSLILYVVGTALLAGAVVTPMLFIGVVLTGVAIGADLPVSLALIAEVAPAGRKGKILTATGLLWAAGAIVPSVAASAIGGLGDLAGRILFGHLVVVSLVVLLLRRTTPESAEWQTAHTASLDRVATGDEVAFDRLPALFRRPLLASLIVTALVYALANLALNTFGQFGTYIYVNLVGIPVGDAALITLIALPVAIPSALVLMRVADRPSRRVWVAAGAVSASVAFFVPVVFGPSLLSFVVTTVFVTFGATFCGEAIYKVWAQELFPTLLRSTAQGVTIAFVRGFAGVVALVTPLALSVGLIPTLIVLACTSTAAAALAVFGVPRLTRLGERAVAPEEPVASPAV